MTARLIYCCSSIDKHRLSMRTWCRTMAASSPSCVIGTHLNQLSSELATSGLATDSDICCGYNTPVYSPNSHSVRFRHLTQTVSVGVAQL